MKLYTVATQQKQFIAAEYKGTLVDLGAAHQAFIASGKADETMLPVFPKTMLGLARCGKAGLQSAERLLQFIAKRPPLPMDLQVFHPLEEVKALAPLPRPGKIILCDDRGAGEELLRWQFDAKFSSTVCGRGEPAMLPNIEHSTAGFEMFAALIVGDKVVEATKGDQLWEGLFGMTFILDFRCPAIEIDFSLLYNNFANSCPMAPCIFTGPEALSASREVEISINGEQILKTEIHFDSRRIIPVLEYLRARISLEPGDVIGLPIDYLEVMKRDLFFVEAGDEVLIKSNDLDVWNIPVGQQIEGAAP